MIIFTITDPRGDIRTLKTLRTTFTVGSAYTNDIIIMSQDVLPEHGIFDIKDGIVFYSDNGFGTSINDNTIVSEFISLTSDDNIQIGRFTITYTLKREESVPVPCPSLTELESQSRTQLHQPVLVQSNHRSFSSPDETSSKTLSTFNQAGTTKTKKQSSNIKSLGNYYGPAIYVLILSIVFWPFGFFYNIIFWKDLTKNVDKRKEQPYGCINMLLIFNAIVLNVICLVIAYFAIKKIINL